jgi:Ca2+-binding RTX toxin-like protein
MANIDGNNNANDLTGTDNADRIRAFGGNDTVFARDGNDTVQGGAGNDELNGEGGRDNMTGGTGNDTMNGGDDNDRVNGESGADQINGGLGDDALFGGANRDTFEHSEGDGDDTIHDWTDGDKVVLAGHDDFAAFEDLEFVEEGNDVVLLLGDDNSIRFRNTQLDELDEGDFEFQDTPIQTFVVNNGVDLLL